MPTKSNKWLSLAIALLGIGLLSNAVVDLIGRQSAWPSQAAWGRGIELMSSRPGGNGIEAFPIQLGRGMYGFVLLDPTHHNLAVYRVVGSVSRLRLIAARNYRYDLQLKDFNNSAPTPVQVKKLIGNGKQ
jgi:hypothetical protein